jgi:MSHA biogenesis protein MshI
MFLFLKRRHLLPGLTGLELRADGATLVRVVREPGRAPRVTACAGVEWSDANDKARTLGRLAAVHDLGRARCATVLDADDYSLLLTEAPDVPSDELRAAMRWRVKDLIDFHIDDATIDVFDVTAPSSPGRTRSMYVVVARNSAIQRRVDLCDAAGVALDIIDIPEMAQRNLASILPEDVSGVAMLTLTETRGLITITRQGELFLSRRLDLGLEALRRAADATPLFEQIGLELQRSLDYFDSHFRQAQIDRLVLSPSAGAVAGLVEHLDRNLNLSASVLDLAAALQLESGHAELLAERGLMALGAALRVEEKAL